MPAARTYYEPAQAVPAAPERRRSAQQRTTTCSTSTTSLGKRIVETRLARTVTMREENAAAALEVMSRFAIDPRWLVYLPPDDVADGDVAASRTCSSTRTRRSPYFRDDGVADGRSARRSTWARAPSSSSAATPASRATRFGVDAGEARRAATRAPAGRSSTTAIDSEAVARPHARRRRRGRAVGRARHRLGRASTASCCPGRPRRRSCIVRSVRRRRRRRRRGPARAVGALEQAAARGLAVDALLDRQRRAHRARRLATSRPTAATSGPSTALADLRWRRSTCSPLAHPSVLTSERSSDHRVWNVPGLSTRP